MKDVERDESLMALGCADEQSSRICAGDRWEKGRGAARGPDVVLLPGCCLGKSGPGPVVFLEWSRA